jgi:large repetitive protein
LAWTDLHDDVVGEFTATGSTLTGSTAYDPFGKVLASTGMAGSLGYQSEWADPATGRVNMLARWYNPDTGQFDTRDTADNNPIPDTVNANRFAYADDNPMTNTDPTGHWSLGGLLKKAKSVVSRGVQAIASTASTVWNAATSFVSTAWHAATSFVSNVYHAAVNYTAKKIDQGRKYVAHKAQQAKQIAKKAVAKAKQVGRVVVTKATRVVQETVNHVKDVYDATAKWVKEHKDALIEVAAIAGGVLAGLACTAATAGAGAVACMVGAAALINLAKDAAQGHIHNWGDAFGSLGTGALQGLAGGVGGIVGGKIAALAVGRLGAFGASIAGRALAGGIAGGAGDAASQYATTGHVNWGGVAMSAGIGAVFGGVSKGGATSAGAEAGESAAGARGGGAARGEPAAPAKGRAEDTAVSCSRASHSFDPNTRVVMADGSTKRIKDVAVTDKVATTDPKTGATEAKPVTALHANQDRDLTDVSVKVAGSGAAVLHTTQHHPFWDQTTSKWVLAADLVAGHTLHADGGGAVTVVAVRNFTDGGGRDMRDLTVADVHTYYVIAGNTPVLVHNSNLCDIHGNPIDESEPLHGPFHRLQSPTQTPEVAQQMMESGELWGKAPRVGLTDVPQAQAHLGPLPEGRAGVEFYTRVPPGPPYPGQARWLAGSPGVREEDGFAKVPIIITKNTQ